MLGGVAEACDEAGVALVLIPRRTDGDLAHDIVRSAVVDGFVAHCDALDDERRTIVEERRLPIVVLDGRPAPDDPTVDIDEEGGAHAAADHVLSLGHRRLAVVRFQPLTTGMFNSVADRRLAGYRAAAAAHGVDPDSITVVDGLAYDRDEMSAVARALLSRPDRPTAVLAMSDEMAVGVIAAARSLGLRVPADLSVDRVRRHVHRRLVRPAADDRAPTARRQGRRRRPDAARQRRRPAGGHVPRVAGGAGVDRSRRRRRRPAGQLPASV